ncbi:MAG: glycosyltransferase [Lachnospiraceae bacterium]|nr:glycosyltransferase [Lachnospiraceae bacterium]
MDGEVTVSIITVCRNSEKTIERTLRSVLSQTVKPKEYLIIDGASEDGTVSVCEGLRSEFKDAGIDFRIYSEPDRGIYDAMNKGIKKASGTLIGILNSDDIYEKPAVEAMCREYRKSPFALAYADIRMVLPSGKTFVKKARLRAYTTSRDWNHPTQFVRRDVYERFQYRCENISDDMDFYFRVKKAGYPIAVVHEVLAEFTMGGVSSSIPLRQVPERVMRRYRIYRQNGYSRLYFLECISFELVKYLGAKFG